MASRDAYRALTPEYAEFSIPPAPSAAIMRQSSLSYEHDKVAEEAAGSDSEESVASKPSRVQYGWTVVLDIMKKNTGLLLITASQAFGAITNISVKMLNTIEPPISTLQLVAIRMFMTYLFCLGYMLYMGIPDPLLGPKGVRSLLVVRGVVGFLAMYGLYYPLQYLSLSDVTVLMFLTPLCTALAGVVLLGENFRRREAFVGIVSLFGVVLIARPTALFGPESHAMMMSDNRMMADGMMMAEKGSSRDRLIAVGMTLVGVMGFAGGYISIRAIGKKAHYMHNLAFFFIFPVIISTILMAATRTPWIVVPRWDWFALFASIIFFGFCTQSLLVLGLQRETAGRGSMAIYTQIVFAAILERIIFHVNPTFLSVLGSVLILSSAVYLSVMDFKENDIVKGSPSMNMSQVETSRELEEGLLQTPPESESEASTPPSRA
ncbi:hypothetical protein CPB84DRAFT_1795735 [Gymnopilus junonius]|uniref:EamA domain-containing protein n=1 Tax=Gymnopilus junonius TaxID=109634 RepID=A0A9P5N9J0_GYMJU|nr:hypothetical protein CPB84DRAFT_1795735 [Gymnopilus junonius]